MTQQQPNQACESDELPAIPGVLFRRGRFFVRQKSLVLVPRYEICRWDGGLSITPLEERLSLDVAKVRCLQLAGLN
jgi:hypothetical protein